MHSEDYLREKTGLLLVDPYNKDASFSWEEIRAAELNGPTFAHAIVSTGEIVDAL